MGTQQLFLLWSLTLFAVYTCVLSQRCTVMCKKKGYVGILNLGQCACSPNYPRPYKKGDRCTVKVIVNNHKRVRLEAKSFKIRQSKQGHKEYFLFENKINSKMNKIHKKEKGGYYLRKIWNRSQMLKSDFIIINSPQVRMKFRAGAKGSLKRKKWKVCMKDNINPNLDKLDCPFTMKNMEKGFNRRHTDISSNETMVTEFCCKTSNFDMEKDEAFVMCEHYGYPRNEITKDGEETCVVCSYSRERAAVQADIPFPNPSKKVDCTCKMRPGAAIGEDCAGGLPCLDSNHNAYCDEAGDNTCKCPSGMVADVYRSRCGPPVNLGEDCSNGEVCYTKYRRGVCDGRVCVCPKTEAPDSTNSYCTKEVAIGASCKPGYTCSDLLSRATCEENKCSCPSPTSPDAASTYCSYKSNYQGDCEDVLDCVETRSKQCNTDTKKCDCESPFADLNNYCSYRSLYNKICQSVKDCLLSNSVCSGQKCVCKKWYRKKSDKVCSAYCAHKTGKQFDLGGTLCNKLNSKCYKCKCGNTPGKWTITKQSFKEKRKDRNACYTKIGRQCKGVQKFITSSSKCGDT